MKSKIHSDPEYLRLRKEFLEATDIIHDLEVAQCMDKRILATAYDDSTKQMIRHRLANRRKGKYGLRSLNKKILAYYKFLRTSLH